MHEYDGAEQSHRTHHTLLLALRSAPAERQTRRKPMREELANRRRPERGKTGEQTSSATSSRPTERARRSRCCTGWVIGEVIHKIIA